MVMGFDATYLLVAAAVLVGGSLLLWAMSEGDLAGERKRRRALEVEVLELRLRLEPSTT